MAETTLLRGAVTALATPVTGASLDRSALARLVAHCVQGGVVGIACCGSTGEGARLSSSERLEVAGAVVAVVPDSVMVVPGLPVSNLTDALRELEDLAALGVTAALVAPPAYFPPDEAELLTLYGTLADRSPVPLLLYNIPMFTAALPVRVVAELARHPNVVGTKDSSRDMEYLHAVLGATRTESFTVYTGTDTLLVPSVLMGVDGAITASANLVPELVSDVLKATTAGELERAWALQDRLTAVVEACRVGSFPAAWKAALHLRGLCALDMVSPGVALPTSLQHDVEAALRRAGVLHSAA
jgi:dihydrodipicolinate synthase/N-acetylneuraminate lyase